MNNQMTLTAYDIALIGGGFTILGALIGALVTYFLAKDRAKQDRIADRHNQAVSEFKAAFNDALINLLFHENTVAFIIKQFFTDHKVAYLSFREQLSDQKKKLFDQAWSQYENYFNKNVKDIVFGLFASAKTQHESEERELVIRLIKDLLDFAKEV
jgi:hypothetical protein